MFWSGKKRQSPVVSKYPKVKVSLGGISWHHQKISRPKLLKKITRLLGIMLLVTGLIAGGGIVVSDLYFRLTEVQAQPILAQGGSPLGGEFSAPSKQLDWQPPYNPDLPAGSWITIDTIGVKTQLRRYSDPDEALRKGVWWVPDWGEPGDDRAMIVAAHRYAYQWMSDVLLRNGQDYSQRHIFYRLPDLQPGDIVEVIHDQRRYSYEIYGGEETDQISDYQADLILYTCKSLSSPIRHVRYARLLDPTQDTQQLSAN